MSSEEDVVDVTQDEAPPVTADTDEDEESEGESTMLQCIWQKWREAVC